MANDKAGGKARKLLLGYRPTKLRRVALKTVMGDGGDVLDVCEKQLNLVNELMEILRGHKLFGDKLYWVIFCTYMTERQPHDTGEILTDIESNCEYIPRSSYFRYRARAIKMLDDHLMKLKTKSLVQGA